jgi:outer membrane biosynthesis protein TonB
MEVRQYIRPDVTVSAIVHLSLVAFVIVYTEVRPFHPAPEKIVPVEVIVADEKKPDPSPASVPTPTPSPDLSQLAKPEQPQDRAPDKSQDKSAAAPQAASPAQKQPSARANRREAAAQPQPQPQPQHQQQAQPQQQSAPAPQPSAPAFTPPEPDVTVKYGVMLGLPAEIQTTAAPSGDKRGEGGDTGPTSKNLASSLVDTLRQHLRTCSKLPAGLSPSDSVAIKLRVQMTPDGRLAAEPALIEGTASLKGVELMRGAIAALQACQPYAMMPVERYGEWKVLDLSFTPHDFNS